MQFFWAILVACGTPMHLPTPTIPDMLHQGVCTMLTIGAIVWGVQNLPQSIQFWSAALNYQLAREPDVDFAILVPTNGEGVQLSLNKVTSPKPRRHHLDLFAQDQTKEVER